MTGPAVTGDPTPAIRADGIAKVYRIYDKPLDRLKQEFLPFGPPRYREFWALRGVDLRIGHGETVGIIGRNGSGKSTLLQIIAGTLTPTAGTIAVEGRVAALLELGSGFNPDFTGIENLYLNASILGLSREQTDAIRQDIIDFSGLGNFVEQPIRTYSTGMVMRLAFAVAISVDPDILIVDEALAVGDDAFQRRCMARIAEIKAKGATILFVSHAASQIVEICDRAVLIDSGEVIYDGPPRRAVNFYHRLLYSPAEKAGPYRAALQEAWRSHGRLPDEKLEPQEDGGNGEPAPAATDEDYFNPGMVPGTTTAYETRGGELSDLQITTPDGRRVNMLLLGRRYVIRYRLRLEVAAWRLAVGTRIKSVTGVELGGATTAYTERLIEFAEAGSEFEIRHEFELRLLEGTYFINAGASALVDGERIWLHRLVDAGMFQVIPGKRRFSNGPVDFAFVSTVEPLTG